METRVNNDDAAGASEVERARLALQVAVGERIRSVRKSVGMGQAEAAVAAGIDKSSMFRLEKGQQNATIDMLARVAIALGVAMDELLIGVEPDAAIIEVRPKAP